MGSPSYNHQLPVDRLLYWFATKGYMFSKIPSDNIHLDDVGWHTGRFHFSFGDYVDPSNSRFGDLIAFNDFIVKPNSGFAPHIHSETEIISYCLEGELTHTDSLGNGTTIKRGGMQYTCAGSGITHSEMNTSLTSSLRFIQVWIQPNVKKFPPMYIARHFPRKERLNTLLLIASGRSQKGIARINQDTNIYVTELEAGRQIQVEQISSRMVYLACLEGAVSVNDLELQEGDAIKILDESGLKLIALTDSHSIMVETINRA
jgi:quercetin 2,3-dioxygenase